jgi:hypothetical protein
VDPTVLCRGAARPYHGEPMPEAAVTATTRCSSHHAGPNHHTDRPGRPHRALLMVLHRMGRAGQSAHGFRASFKTWAEEPTQYPVHNIEQALAYQVGNCGEPDVVPLRRGVLS